MKYGLGEIIGRRIIGVFLRVRDDPPTSQVLLALEGGTAYEFYSTTGRIAAIGRMRFMDLEETANYMRKTQKFCYEARFDPESGKVVECQYRGTDGSADVRHIEPLLDWHARPKDEQGRS